MTALCDICQRPMATILNPSALTYARLSEYCTCDCRDRFTWGLKCEIKRLRVLVQQAWDEGNANGDRYDWHESEVRKEMEKET